MAKINMDRFKAASEMMKKSGKKTAEATPDVVEEKKEEVKVSRSFWVL